MPQQHCQPHDQGHCQVGPLKEIAIADVQCADALLQRDGEDYHIRGRCPGLAPHAASGGHHTTDAITGAPEGRVAGRPRDMST